MGRKENPLPEQDEAVLSVGSRLRRLRRQHGLTLTELSSRLKYSKPYVSAVENNTVSPSRAIVDAYAREFGVPRAELDRSPEVAAERPAPEESGSQLDGVVSRIAGEF